MEKNSMLNSALEVENANDFSIALGAGEILLGRIEAIDDAGNALVSFLNIQVQQTIALTTIPILPQHIGREVALMFTQGIESKPIIMGLIHSPLQQVLENVIANTKVSGDEDELVFSEVSNKVEKYALKSLHQNSIYIDGKQVIMEGQEEIVLRCGESSITLSKNGKISIRGKYLLSRSSGVNRILGGAVQIN